MMIRGTNIQGTTHNYINHLILISCINHFRWFPKCPYVMLVKGSNYIKNVMDRSFESGGNQSGNQSMQATPSTAMTGAAMSQLVDDAMSTQSAMEALSMGLNAGRVRAVMQRKIALTGRPYTSTESLVSAVLDGQIEDEGFESIEADRGLENQVTQLLLSAVSSVGLSNEDNDQASSSSRANIIASTSSVPEEPAYLTSIEDDPSKSPSDERRLKNVECKICMAEEVGVVFLPCGHLLSCVMCAPAMVKCPLCRQQILGRVRTFLS